MNAHVKTPSRREVMVISAAAVGGSLLIGCSPAKLLSIGADSSHFGPFGPFLRIAPDGAVTVVSKHIEFGQGNHAGLAAIVAEELDADWNAVKVVQAPANTAVYANLGMGFQGTGGSSAIANSWPQLRKVGAAARAMFVQAAAARWGVPGGEIAVKDSVLSHPSGKQAHFGELVGDAAKVVPPKDPPLKNPANFTLIGTDRVRRKDAAAKSTGTARFTQDVHKPNMLTAMVAHSPRFGGKVKRFDAAAARKIAGVVDVFEIPTGVAVVAQNSWAARQGRDALVVTWDDDKAEKRGTDAILARYRDLAAGRAAPAGAEKWQAFEARGGAAPAGGKVVEALYDFPYLAHATMEPMNCVAEIGGGANRLTTGSQVPSL
ncbi:MAG TPA: molybdopterin cofactor-binding domain-containing protein, partial [Caulobacteraceae bacterium]